MPRFIIEREIPGAGAFGHAELRTIAARSNEVLAAMGGGIAWQHSFVTADKLYCVYEADGAAPIREHAARGGFPADRVEEVLHVIGPGTADGPSAGHGPPTAAERDEEEYESSPPRPGAPALPAGGAPGQSRSRMKSGVKRCR